MTTFTQKLKAKWEEDKYVCVGLDPVADKLPTSQGGVLFTGGPVVELALGLCMNAMAQVVDETKDIAACYKPNWAFYLSYGSHGLAQLERLIKYIKTETDVPVILDCKVGDIGNTNEHYARMAFNVIGADAITIHPYLGWEANKPFLDREDKGIFVLCRTSNPGSSEFQGMPVALFDASWDFLVNSQFRTNDISPSDKWELYRHVAAHVADSDTWNQHGNCGLVTGATYPDEIRQVRAIAPDIPLLIPGIGTQGGDLEATVWAAKHRFLINSSSGIIFADDPRAEAKKLDEQIRAMLNQL